MRLSIRIFAKPFTVHKKIFLLYSRSTTTIGRRPAIASPRSALHQLTLLFTFSFYFDPGQAMCRGDWFSFFFVFFPTGRGATPFQAGPRPPVCRYVPLGCLTFALISFIPTNPLFTMLTGSRPVPCAFTVLLLEHIYCP